MENLEKIKRLLSIISEAPERIITLESRLSEDLGMDSLDIVELTLELEDEFKIWIYEDEVESFKKIKTVGAVLDYINNKTGGK